MGSLMVFIMLLFCCDITMQANINNFITIISRRGALLFVRLVEFGRKKRNGGGNEKVSISTKNMNVSTKQSWILLHCYYENRFFPRSHIHFKS